MNPYSTVKIRKFLKEEVSKGEFDGRNSLCTTAEWRTALNGIIDVTDVIVTHDEYGYLLRAAQMTVNTQIVNEDVQALPSLVVYRAFMVIYTAVECTRYCGNCNRKFYMEPTLFGVCIECESELLKEAHCGN
jgi:hypothetical protein